MVLRCNYVTLNLFPNIDPVLNADLKCVKVGKSFSAKNKSRPSCLPHDHVCDKRRKCCGDIGLYCYKAVSTRKEGRCHYRHENVTEAEITALTAQNESMGCRFHHDVCDGLRPCCDGLYCYKNGSAEKEGRCHCLSSIIAVFGGLQAREEPPPFASGLIGFKLIFSAILIFIVIFVIFKIMIFRFDFGLLVI